MYFNKIDVRCNIVLQMEPKYWISEITLDLSRFAPEQCTLVLMYFVFTYFQQLRKTRRFPFILCHKIYEGNLVFLFGSHKVMHFILYDR